MTQRISIELARNEAYWDKARVPKLEKLILIPMPEATTRLAALRSGQVDWIEVPPPDAIPSLKSAGFQISLKEYPHLWPWVLSVGRQIPRSRTSACGWRSTMRSIATVWCSC